VGKERDEETGLYYYGARYYAAWIYRFVSVDPMKEERNWLTPYNYVQNNPLNRVDPTGMVDEGLSGNQVSTPDKPIYYTKSGSVSGDDLKGIGSFIVVKGSYWQNRISSELNSGEGSKSVLKALATAITATTITLDDVKAENRKFASKDWGSDSPADMISNINDSDTIKVFYGDGKYFTVDMKKEEPKPVEKSLWEQILDFIGQYEGKYIGGGGYRFTWSIGQGQETRKAKYPVETVAIDDIMGAFGITKTASGVKRWQNLAEPLGYLFNCFSIGCDGPIKEKVEEYKKDSKVKLELENQRIMDEYKGTERDSTIAVFCFEFDYEKGDLVQKYKIHKQSRMGRPISKRYRVPSIYK
jgi:RHS repeat-associated protein